ncbi:hypothetical protein TB2_043302 [Malus domestica]
MKATDLVLSDRVLGPTTKSSQPCSSTSRARHRLVLQLCKVETLLSLFLIVHILRRLWVLDTVEDKGLGAVGSNYPLIEELCVFPSSPDGDDVVDGVIESRFIVVSNSCPRLHYVLYFCWQMTNATVATVAQNCPDITHFHLCIMTPAKPDHLMGKPMDKAFGAVVKTCTKLDRLKHG